MFFFGWDAAGYDTVPRIAIATRNVRSFIDFPSVELHIVSRPILACRWDSKLATESRATMRGT